MGGARAVNVVGYRGHKKRDYLYRVAPSSIGHLTIDNKKTIGYNSPTCISFVEFLEWVDVSKEFY